VLPFGMAMSMFEAVVVEVCSCEGIAVCWKKWPVLPVSAIVETNIDVGGSEFNEDKLFA
jgi:hypothetical protein